jgi:hypothetical protein
MSVGVGDGDENEAGRVGPYRIEYQWILAMSAGGGGEPLYRAGLGYPQASLSGQDRAGQGRGRARRGETGQDKTGEYYVWSYFCTSCHLAGQSRRDGGDGGDGGDEARCKCKCEAAMDCPAVTCCCPSITSHDRSSHTPSRPCVGDRQRRLRGARPWLTTFDPRWAAGTREREREWVQRERAAERVQSECRAGASSVGIGCGRPEFVSEK